MKQKYTLIFLLMVFALLLTSFANAASLDISMDQNPFPVHAGENAQLNFTIVNDGTEDLTNILLDLDVDNPITLRSDSEKPRFNLTIGQSKTVIYNIHVESDAQEGTEQVTLNYDIGTSNNHKDFDVEIAPDQVYLMIESVTSSPSQVAPGESVILNLNLRNTANSKIKNIILALDLTNIPFAPESVTEERIASINERASSQTSFNLIVLSSASIQVYKIPLTITYEDSYGHTYSREDFISIDVFEKPSIDVIVDKDSLIQNMASKFDIKVLNKGLGKVSFVEVTILPSSDYDINGQDSQYIGDVESDDYSSVEFNIVPKKENFDILVQLDYRDANNQKYSETRTVPIEAYTLQEAQRLGILPAFPWFVILVILVVIALIIFFIVRRRNKKKRLMMSHRQE